MKKIISLCLLMAYGCISVMAGQDAKEYKTYVKDNHRVYYCTSQGISIVVDPSPRGLFEPHITIINDSGHDFVFEPKEIRAYAYAAPGNTYKETRYRVERFLEKGGDASLLEQDPLDIYTPEKYMRKTNSAFWWGNILTETIVAGVEAIGPQDADTRYLNEISREKRIDEASYDNKQELKRIEEGYWRANTIFDHSEHNGFIAVKPVKSSYLILDIPVDGETYRFVINDWQYTMGNAM